MYKDMKSSRVRLGYGLGRAGVSRATWFRKVASHPLAPTKRTEPDGSSSYNRAEVDRFVNAIKTRGV
ncbi:MAG: hypothetical protein HON39_08110 [Marinovum sp.]|nr:hypothetical protein [Marinovum sp.]